MLNSTNYDTAEKPANSCEVSAHFILGLFSTSTSSPGSYCLCYGRRSQASSNNEAISEGFFLLSKRNACLASAISTLKHCQYGITKILRNLKIREGMCKSHVLPPLPGQPFSKFTVLGRQGKCYDEIRIMGIRSIRTEALQNKLSTLIIHWSGFGLGILILLSFSLLC